MKKKIIFLIGFLLFFTACGEKKADVTSGRFTLDGVEYTLPVHVSEFEANGWGLGGPDFFDVDTYVIEAGKSDDWWWLTDGNPHTSLYRDTMFYIELANLSNEDLPLKENYVTIINVGWFSLEPVLLVLPGNITVGSSYDDMIAAFGEPDEWYTFVEQPPRDIWRNIYFSDKIGIIIDVAAHTQVVDRICMKYLDDGGSAASDQKENQQSIPNGSANEKWEIKAARLLTKEEFLKKVSENEKALGVTVEDFKDIDVDDFIEDLKISQQRFGQYVSGRLIFISSYNTYLRYLPRRALKKYQSTELTVIDSTKEEFEIFAVCFIENLGYVVETPESFASYSGRGLIKEYEYETDEGYYQFLIGRTFDIETLRSRHWRFTENPVHALVPFGDGSEYGAHMFLSENGKFFLIIIGVGELSEHMVKSFKETGD